MALGKLDQVCAQLPDPKLLIRPALFREALDTSALEGTVGLLRDLLEAQLPNAQYLSRETIEINAYVEVAMTAFKMIGDRRISIGLLSELQARLFRDTQDKPEDIGRPRQGLVWIGEKEGRSGKPGSSHRRRMTGSALGSTRGTSGCRQNMSTWLL